MGRDECGIVCLSKWTEFLLADLDAVAAQSLAAGRAIYIMGLGVAGALGGASFIILVQSLG